MVAEVGLDPQTLVPRVVGRYSPVFVDHAEGIYVWDRDGQRYADFTSGIAVVNAGHCHPRIVEAIRSQAGKIIHAQQNILLHEPMLDAAADFAPSADRVLAALSPKTRLLALASPCNPTGRTGTGDSEYGCRGRSVRRRTP